MKESFWGDLFGQTKLAWKRALEAESEWERDRFAAREFYQRRSQQRQPYRIWSATRRIATLDIISVLRSE